MSILAQIVQAARKELEESEERGEHWVRMEDAPKIVGVSRVTLYKWMKEYGITPRRSKPGQIRRDNRERFVDVNHLKWLLEK